MRRAFLALALALVTACVGAPEPGDEELEAPSVTLGTGSRAWSDLPEEGPMTVYRGPQGGIHVLARVRFTGLRGDVRVSFAIVDPDTGRRVTLGDPPRRRSAGRGLRPYGAGYESAFPELVIFEASDLAAVHGRRCRLEATVEEKDRPDRVAQASRLVLLTRQ